MLNSIFVLYCRQNKPLQTGFHLIYNVTEQTKKDPEFEPGLNICIQRKMRAEHI